MLDSLSQKSSILSSIPSKRLTIVRKYVPRVEPYLFLEAPALTLSLAGC